MGVFDAVNKFNAKSELLESKDEMLLGEVIRVLSRRGFVADAFHAGDGLQRVRFRSPKSDVLDYLWITQNRYAGTGRMSAAVVGARASITLVGEVKLELTDPDDLVKMWRTDAANVLKMPLLGQVKVNHRVTSVTARLKVQINIDDFVLKGEPGVVALMAVLDEKTSEVREAVRPFARPAVAG